MSIYPELRYCNCAACGKELIGEASALAHWRHLSAEERTRVAVRVNGRPYCPGCDAWRARPTAGRARPVQEDDPSQQNAVRAMEDGVEGVE